MSSAPRRLPHDVLSVLHFLGLSLASHVLSLTPTPPQRPGPDICQALSHAGPHAHGVWEPTASGSPALSPTGTGAEPFPGTHCLLHLSPRWRRAQEHSPLPASLSLGAHPPWAWAPPALCSAQALLLHTEPATSGFLQGSCPNHTLSPRPLRLPGQLACLPPPSRPRQRPGTVPPILSLQLHISQRPERLAPPHFLKRRCFL